MIQADLHLHTLFSHGKMSPLGVHALAEKNNFRMIGFSEHSPRPQGYNYTNEYRDQLESQLDVYASQVLGLKKNASSNKNSCQVLFGMEIDWLPGEQDFVRAACGSHDFDYLLGSVHFLDQWGFDDKIQDWQGLSQEGCDKLYRKYFEDWKGMLASGLFQIASHPDLIKIFSVGQFHEWLKKPESLDLIRAGLQELKNAGMAMEVSSAGLRKPCGEIYPAPAIMRMAQELEIPIALASDTHAPGDFMYGFADLEKYAKNFGYDRQAVFEGGKMMFYAF